MSTTTSASRQRGQAIAEYVYVVPVMLLLILGAVQLAFIYQAKATLNYATFVATRQGALKNGAMTEIQDALAGGLAPLFTHVADDNQKLAALKTAYAYADRELRDARLARIEIVNPTSTAWDAYGAGKEIPNDNLMYRDTGASGGMSIQDANLLKVRVSYCFRMVVPIINKLIFNLAVSPPAVLPDTPTTAAGILASQSSGTAATCTDLPADEYRIPIAAEAVVRMQSPFKHPGKWTVPTP